jgi:hypothetical protein
VGPVRTGTFWGWLPLGRGPKVGSVARRVGSVLLVALLSACSPAVSPAPSGPAPTLEAVAAVATPSPSPSPRPEPTPSDELVAADLDGVLTSAALAHRLPLVVSIDDNRIARPQSGFNAASIVWQAPADGYESRYLLVIQERDTAAIGPVRSARLYLAQWAAELRGALAHYGGDRLTRAWMSANRGRLFTDVDGIGSGNPAYHRIKTREAPHNAYTSTADLWRVAVKLGADETFDSALHARPFRDDSAPAARGTAQTIAVPYRTVKVGYAYDPTTNAYLRSLDGKPHVDPADGGRVTASTVVVLFMTFRTDSTIEKGHNRPVLGFVGSGKAQVFMEGRLISGSWSKAGPADPTLILGPGGEEMPLLRGRIFIQVVPIGTRVLVGS